MSSSNGVVEADVAVVGAGIAGCTAATLFARAGARVALIDSRQDNNDDKRACTHVLQPSARPVLERLGLLTSSRPPAPSTRRWTSGPAGAGYGRASTATAPAYALNLRRAQLDPLLRRMAGDTPGVQLLLGRAVTGLHREVRKTTGVLAGRTDGSKREIRARLVGAATGARHAPPSSPTSPPRQDPTAASAPTPTTATCR